MSRSSWVAAVIALLVVVAPTGAAHADPAGPTDYLSEVTSVEPATERIEVAILGGDSFLELAADPGVDVRVTGYRGEPYLWFRPDGTVLENRLSPTTYLNEERFGNEFPDFADPDAEPEWREVADDGSYAWHDHRAHWMQSIRPAGLGPGDQILEAVIPIVVDGDEIEVTVTSVWQESPSVLPFVLGAIGGIGAAGAGWVLARRTPAVRWPLVFVGPAAVALVSGWIDYTSLPSETATPITTWVFPAIGLVALFAASTAGWRDPFWTTAGVLIGGVQLTLWAWLELDGLFSAILPTSAPDAAHRFAVGLAGLAGPGAVVVAAERLIRLLAPHSRDRGHESERSGTVPGQATT